MEATQEFVGHGDQDQAKIDAKAANEEPVEFEANSASASAKDGATLASSETADSADVDVTFGILQNAEKHPLLNPKARI